MACLSALTLVFSLTASGLERLAVMYFISRNDNCLVYDAWSVMPLRARITNPSSMQ